MNEKEIEEYAQRRAINFCSCRDGECDLKLGFLEGIEAGRELGRWEGRTDVLNELRPIQRAALPRKFREAEANLKALLENGEEK